MAKKYTKAEAASRDELKIRRKYAEKDELSLATCLSDLTYFLRDQGKLAGAEESIRECVVIRRKKLGKDNSDVNSAFRMLSDILRKQGKPAETLQ